MKKVIFVFFTSYLWLSPLFSQYCFPINYPIFSAVKIGQPIPAGFAKFIKYDKSDEDFQKRIYSKDVFSNINNDKLKMLFSIADTFDLIKFKTNKLGKIVQYNLNKEVTLEIPDYISISHYPKNYDSLNIRITDYFGEPKDKNVIDKTDSTVVLYNLWECGDIQIGSAVRMTSGVNLEYMLAFFEKEKETPPPPRKKSWWEDYWSVEDDTWMLVTLQDNSIILVKREYETNYGNTISVWFKTYKKTIKNKIVTITKSMELYEINCSDKKFKLIKYANYNNTGKVLKSRNLEDYEQYWDNIIPESLGELMFNKACSLK